MSEDGVRPAPLLGQVLDRAREAFEHERWRAACSLFRTADEDGEGLATDDLERWALAAQLVGDGELAKSTWERAHLQLLDRGEFERAVRSAFWLAFGLLNRGQMAQAGGWLGARTPLNAGTRPSQTSRTAKVLDHAGKDWTRPSPATAPERRCWRGLSATPRPSRASPRRAEGLPPEAPNAERSGCPEIAACNRVAGCRERRGVRRYRTSSTDVSVRGCPQHAWPPGSRLAGQPTGSLHA